MAEPHDVEKGGSRRDDYTPTSASDESNIEAASLSSDNLDAEDLKQTLPSHSADVSRTTSSKHGASLRATQTTDPSFEVDWDGPDDSANPRNWPLWYRGVMLMFISMATTVVVLYSTSYTTAIPGMMDDFHTENEPLVTLGLTTYLIGLAVGTVLLAPLSEIYGRRPVYIISMSIFALLVIPCALSQSLAGILVTRFFGAVAGSAMIANAPGSVADIAGDNHRALAFSIWSIGPINGPVFGPVIGGFTSEYLGWRWTNWLVLILSGVALVCVSIIKESYSPTILRKKAKRLRKETGDNRWWSRYDSKLELPKLLKVNLSRPFVMAVTEPICVFWDLYIGVVYAILYLCFVAYPIVFAQIRGWSPGMTGLAFVGIGVGSFLVIILEPLIRRMINSHKIDPETGHVPPEAMVSAVCIGSICAPVGELWFAWTCVPNDVHWIWPILAGVPFGAGNALVFIYASNYLAHSYGIYSASAMAGNTVVRSVIGGTLPLAGPAMYHSLNPHWAGTLLGLLEVILIPIPFVFYKYGHRIRGKSALIRSMQRDKAKLAGKRASKGEPPDSSSPLDTEKQSPDPSTPPLPEETREKKHDDSIV
ncbi:MAG: hypothetical protein M1837_006112 [Sclerophora amabilis]|nr:MAG: hypothetical protein M1837_006112 [Sclerophora amabilis]